MRLDETISICIERKEKERDITRDYLPERDVAYLHARYAYKRVDDGRYYYFREKKYNRREAIRANRAFASPRYRTDTRARAIHSYIYIRASREVWQKYPVILRGLRDIIHNKLHNAGYATMTVVVEGFRRFRVARAAFPHSILRSTGASVHSPTK